MSKVLMPPLLFLLVCCGQALAAGGQSRPEGEQRSLESADRSDVRLLAAYALDERFIRLEEPVFAAGKATVKSRVGSERCTVTLARAKPSKGESFSGWQVEKIVCSSARRTTAQ